jgi:hypothetical protein
MLKRLLDGARLLRLAILFTPAAQGPRNSDGSQGDAIAVWAQGDAGVLSIWANRYDVGSGSWGTATLIENDSGIRQRPPGKDGQQWERGSGLGPE